MRLCSLFFSVCLTSLSIMSTRFIHAIANDRIYIFLMVNNGEGNGTPLQYSCLENPMDRGARWVAVHGVGKSRTRLSDFTFTFHFHALEKEMATHSSVLAWRIPGTGEPGGLSSLGSHRVRHDWSDLAAWWIIFHCKFILGFPGGSVYTTSLHVHLLMDN